MNFLKQNYIFKIIDGKSLNMVTYRGSLVLSGELFGQLGKLFNDSLK
jgi:hypothetical protein